MIVMVKKYRMLLCIAWFVTISPVQASSPMKNLKDTVNTLIGNHHGTFAVAFQELNSSNNLFINESINFHAASTMKTPVMVEVFKQAEEGRLSLSDSLEIINSFKSIVDGSTYSLDLGEDSEDALYSSIGRKVSIRNLVEKMITVSSNFATNILIERVGANNVMKTMRELGLKDINVLRGVEDGKAYAAGMNNTTTAKDLLLLFERIAQKSVLTERSCNEMLEILFRQKFNDMIPLYLPDNVRVAHKTGSITNVQHDSGIIYLPDGRVYVLVILSKDLKNNKDGIDVIAKISKIIYDYMMD